MPCDVWRTLLEHCYETEMAHIQALADSSGLLGVEFDLAVQRAEEARNASHASERALLRHEQMHDCMRNSAAAKAS
jgi:hypothetical protein